MLGYLNTTECRSRYFLNYFGEADSAECGRCDNCLGSHASLPGQQAASVSELEAVRHRILDLVRQRGRAVLDDLHLEGVSDRKVAEVLHQMSLEEDFLAL